MGIISKLLGICSTEQPDNPDSWNYAGNTITVDLDKMPELANPGGAARLEGKGLPQRVLVLQGADNNYQAFINKCAHVGKRRLDPIDNGTRVQCCSVGQSVFDLSGQRLSGSAKGNITPLTVQKDGTTLIITNITSGNKRLSRRTDRSCQPYIE